MSERLQRVSEELREILALEIQRLKDPRLGFVTVTSVRVTPDLRKARVFYTVLGEERGQQPFHIAVGRVDFVDHQQFRDGGSSFEARVQALLASDAAQELSVRGHVLGDSL